jgi:putative oxidoreductase
LGPYGIETLDELFVLFKSEDHLLGSISRIDMKGESSVISVSSRKVLTIGTWILQVLIGSLFLFSGASKLFGVTEMVTFFAQVGFGQWLRYVLGVLEVGSAVALFFPRQAFYGALVLSFSLLGHIVIHEVVLHRPAAFLVVLLAVTLLIAYLRRSLAKP